MIFDLNYWWLDLLVLVPVLERNIMEEEIKCCPECGEELSEEDEFWGECLNCGYDLDQEEENEI